MLEKIEEQRVTEDDIGWHQWLNGHEFEQPQGDSEEQVSLVCYIVHGTTKNQKKNLGNEQQQFKFSFFKAEIFFLGFIFKIFGGL